MTTPSQPNTPKPGGEDVDRAFAELISSMPELAAMASSQTDAALEDVAISIPNPVGAGQPLQLVVQVPAEIAPALRAEFSPDRVAAMLQAITAMATLSMPPPQT